MDGPGGADWMNWREGGGAVGLTTKGWRMLSQDAPGHLYRRVS